MVYMEMLNFKKKCCKLTIKTLFTLLDIRDQFLCLCVLAGSSVIHQLALVL